MNYRYIITNELGMELAHLKSIEDCYWFAARYGTGGDMFVIKSDMYIHIETLQVKYDY